MHGCFPKHWCMGTARMKQDKQTEVEGTKRNPGMERKVCTKKICPEGLSLPNENTIIINTR